MSKISCGAVADDLAGWQDAVLKALERKHRAEHDFLLTLLQDDGGGELRREARGVTAEEREKRIHELRGKRDELDFGVKGDGRLASATNQHAFDSILLGSMRDLMGSIRDLIGSTRDLMGSICDLIDSTRDLMGSICDLTGSTRDLIGSTRDLIGSIRSIAISEIGYAF